jgi:hypothetical protein
MNWAVAGGLVFAGSLLFLLTLLMVRVLGYRHRTNSEPEEFSINRYDPVVRLFSADDLTFLSSLPGCRPAVAARLRRERKRILRMYLRELADDFHALHAQARTMVTASQDPSAGPVGALLHQQLTFWRAMLLIELRLLVPWAQLPHIDVQGLMESMEALRLDLTQVSATAS